MSSSVRSRQASWPRGRGRATGNEGNARMESRRTGDAWNKDRISYRNGTGSCERRAAEVRQGRAEHLSSQTPENGTNNAIPHGFDSSFAFLALP